MTHFLGAGGRYAVGQNVLFYHKVEIRYQVWYVLFTKKVGIRRSICTSVSLFGMPLFRTYHSITNSEADKSFSIHPVVWALVCGTPLVGTSFLLTKLEAYLYIKLYW